MTVVGIKNDRTAVVSPQAQQPHAAVLQRTVPIKKNLGKRAVKWREADEYTASSFFMLGDTFLGRAAGRRRVDDEGDVFAGQLKRGPGEGPVADNRVVQALAGGAVQPDVVPGPA